MLLLNFRRKKRKNRRIAIIGTRGYPSYYGGFETAVRKLAPHLVNNEWQVTVYGRHGATRADDPTLDDRVLRVRTKGFELKSLSTLSYGLTSTLHAVINRPDVALVMNCANGYWLPLLKLRGIPTAVNVDGIEWERQKWGATAKAIFKFGAIMTARFADVIIADSHEIAKRWREDFGRQSEFIPYGGEIPPILQPVEGLTAGTYILAVARFVPENSIPQFFEAIRILDGQYPVVIVGSSGYGGPLDSEAQELADQYDNVRWLGHVANDQILNALWQNAGAYFHGHSVGGTNPALVQAMACGSPVVARDTVYNREVLADHGRFVQPDARSIAAAVSAQVQEVMDKQYDSSSLLQRSREEYSWELVCDRYNAVMLSLAASHKNMLSDFR
ncbi:DUF1972 domain-containing protein [Kocuria rosea]|nr:DUF1972 domain-containing protein [Kocuria rosea]THE19458.1 DUF1972 domain-containing protein [Kocuria rosea]